MGTAGGLDVFLRAFYLCLGTDEQGDYVWWLPMECNLWPDSVLTW